MTRHRVYRDDTLVYDYTEGTVPPVNPEPPIPPVGPPVTPPSGTGLDLSDKVEHTVHFQEGVPQNFFCRCSGGYAEISGVAVANTAARKVYYSVNGGPEQSFTPLGDFRFKAPESTWMAAGSVIQSTVRIEGILGEGRFSLQAVGAVGP